MPIRTKEEAQKWRAQLDILLSNISDKEASTCSSLFAGMHYNEGLIKAGTRINWGGVLKVAEVDLWDNEENNPDNAQTLWRDVLYKNGIRIITYPITVTNPFSKDERGWWENKVYKSLKDNNIYTPTEYPAWWEVQILEGNNA